MHTLKLWMKSERDRDVIKCEKTPISKTQAMNVLECLGIPWRQVNQNSLSKGEINKRHH